MMTQLIRQARMMFVLLCVAIVSGTLSHNVIVSQDLPLLPLPPTPLPQQDAPGSIDGFRGVFPPEEQQPFTSSNTRLNPELAHEQSQSLALSCEGVTSYDWCYALDFTMAGHGFTGGPYTAGIGFHGPSNASSIGGYDRLYAGRAALTWGGSTTYNVRHIKVLYDFQPGENNGTDIAQPGVRLSGIFNPAQERTLIRFDQPGSGQVGTWNGSENIASGIVLNYVLSFYIPPSITKVRDPNPVGSLTIKGIVIAGNNAYPPIVAQVPASPPQCTFSPSNLNYSVRAEAHMNGTIIASVTDARTVHVLGKVSGEIPEPEGGHTYESDIWWLISFGERDANQNLIPAGYVYSETVDEGSTCQGLAAVVPLREAVYIAPPQYFVACSGPMAGEDARLNVRSGPSLSSTILGQLNAGDEVIYLSEVEEPVPSGDLTYQFGKILYNGIVAYLARTVTYQNSSVGHFFVQGFDPACPQPIPPPQIDTADPARRQYFTLYRAAIFFAIYNETNENQMQSALDIVDGHPTASLVAYPLPSFYSSNSANGVAQFSSNPSDPRLDGLDRRDHRYLQARLMLDNVPEFTTNDFLGANGETGFYDTGFGFFKRWAGTFTVTERPLWRIYGKCNDKTYDPNASYGPYEIWRYPGVYQSGNGFQAISWFNKYAGCRLADPKETAFFAAFDEISRYVDLAIEDKISNMRSPLPIPSNANGQSQIKHANTCFVDFDAAPNGCKEGEAKPGFGVDMIAFCTPERDCRDRKDLAGNGIGYVDEFGNTLPVSISMATWLDTDHPFTPPTVRYPTTLYNDAAYVAPPRDVRTQVVYGTTKGYRYYVSVGLYQYKGETRYLLMGLGKSKITPPGLEETDTIENAFDRHWSRLNHGGTIRPQSFRPDHCMLGLSHVIRNEVGGIQTWYTITYQIDSTYGNGIENWFCGEG